ncbi:MAG: putative Endoribonuclease MazF9 [Candidatus Thorarchaeota archaeon]|nr:MAG: putative Endoribonuclease MazF9 [Candidatus Thorarchaeota archaeon]
MSSPSSFNVGDIVFVDLEPVKGHEQGRNRPCVVVAIPTKQSSGRGHFNLLIVVPLTSRERRWWTVVKIPNQSGLISVSYALCHQIRSISTKRVLNTTGAIRNKDLMKIRIVLGGVLSIP